MMRLKLKKRIDNSSKLIVLFLKIILVFYHYLNKLSGSQHNLKRVLNIVFLKGVQYIESLFL